MDKDVTVLLAIVVFVMRGLSRCQINGLSVSQTLREWSFLNSFWHRTWDCIECACTLLHYHSGVNVKWTRKPRDLNFIKFSTKSFSRFRLKLRNNFKKRNIFKYDFLYILMNKLKYCHWTKINNTHLVRLRF